MKETSLRRGSAALAIACASILCAAQAARADAVTPAATAGQEEIEEIVVTGFRYSIETSVQVKRDFDGIVESVSAEEIGKLPEVSVAEAIARLPGLAAQRVDGRAQVIAIRGMAPKYAVTLLNGREMVSTGDNRSFEYDQFPAELINQANVYKTQDAGLVAQGLSGTVDLQTIRPLSYNSTQLIASIRGEKNANGELNDGWSDTGGRASISYVDQFRDGTIGVAFGYAHLDNPGQEKYYKSWWWGDTDAWCGNQGWCAINGLPHGTPGSPGPGPQALLGFESGVTSTKRTRDGAMGVLEFRPNEDLHSMIDLYYSKFDQTSIQREMQASLTTWDGIAYTNPVIQEVNGNPIVVGGDISNVNPVILNRYNDRSDDVFAAGWNTQARSDQWTIGLDLSYSKAKRDEINSELTAGALAPISLNDIRVNAGNTGVSQFHPSIDVADPSLVRLKETWGRGGRASTPRVEDEMKSAAATASYEFGGTFKSLDFGVSYSDRTKDMNRSEVYYYLAGGGPSQLTSGYLDSPSSLGFVGNPGVLSWKFNRVLHDYYTSGVPAALDQQPGRRWSVDEKVSRMFAKLNIDWETVVPIRGNVGVQYVHADQNSSGFVWNSNGNRLDPIADGANYDNFLPSLNLSAQVTANTYVRLGLAKEMARPNMEDMRAGFSYSLSTGTPPYLWSGSGGNPQLKPWLAKAADLSLEHYFDKRSYVALAGFYKKLDSFVYTQSYDYDFTGFPNTTSVTPSSNIGTMSKPGNGEGGNVKGVEVSGVFDAGLVWESLDGLGLMASYSHTTSDLHEQNNPARSLDGLSGDVASAVLYYENHGVSVRLGDRYRSKYETTVRGTFGDNVFSAIESENIVDFQAGYSFSDESRLKGVQVFFQVNNLTDEPYRTSVSSSVGTAGYYNPKALLPERYNTYGTQYLLGVTYKIL